MRIGIREQLGLLVLLTTLIALAVVAIATWVNNYSFVLGVSSSSLALAASLYANQLSSDLLLLQSSVRTLSTRVLLQNALQRYDMGNNTDANWVRAAQDLQSSLGGAGTSTMLLQLQVFPKDGDGIGGKFGVLNVTGQEIDGTIPLPYSAENGSTVYFGNNGTGFPPILYPNLTYTPLVANSTYNLSSASYNGRALYSNTTLVLGPWLLNESFALLSITMPIINNTSITDILGWLTVVVNGRSIFNIETSTQGLGDTGQILLIRPYTFDQMLPPDCRTNGSRVNKTRAGEEDVDFVLPPVQNVTRSTRHPSHAFGLPNTPFKMKSYPAILEAFYSGSESSNGADSIIATNNEEGDSISTGYALVMSQMVNWALIVEQSHAEVTAPIRRLRDILLACVFGTVGGLILILIPIAHFSVRPIRRLREATKRTVEPEMYPSEDGSSGRSFVYLENEENEATDTEEEAAAEEGRKEGFLGYVTQWRGRDNARRKRRDSERSKTFRIPGKVQERKHFVKDELTDLTKTFNEMSDKLTKQYVDLEEKVKDRTRQLEASKKAAEVANETKTLFIANISHELKTPLNGILGMCAVCMQEDDPTKLKRSLGIIYKSGDLLLHLLTDLLTFTKNQIGQQLSLEEREFRLADVCAQLVSIFEKQASDGHINLGVTYQGPQDGPEPAVGAPLQTGYGPYGTGRIRDMFLWGDQHRILQVIINLVSNSLKFTPEDGSVDVRIRCLGDVPEKPESRKGSLHSKQSRRHSSKGSKQKVCRVSSANGSTASATARGRDSDRYSDTALHINGAEPKIIPSLAIRERSTTPHRPPLNARTLLFEFEVEDTGPGIPEDQQQKVFEPFMQGDLGLSKKYRGTGLGLSICSQLASLMKGNIKLESKVGVGSKFTMQIPLIFIKERADSTTSSKPTSRRNSANFVGTTVDGSHTPQLPPSSSEVSIHSDPGIDTPTKPRLVGLSQPFFAAPSPLEDPDKQLAAIERVTAQAVQRGDKIRVLVAEDNQVNQEVVLRMLKLEDIYDVTVAKDGKEAFDIVKESMDQRRFFNLIFMDVQMPNLDGIESTRLIRKMGYSAPIVALTAFAEESNKKECKESGMDDFLAKPIKRPELKKVLKQYCATIPEAPEEPLVEDQDKRLNGTIGKDKPISPMP